jgi:prepilin-type N-terminal cleavage/methylation domain-containing protein
MVDRQKAPLPRLALQCRPGLAPTRQARGDAGFSFVEVMAAMGIVCVIAAIIVPAFQAVQEEWQLESARSQLAAQLSQARLNAIKRNRMTWLLVSADENSYTVQTVGAGGAVQTVVPPVRVPDQVEFLLPGGAATVQYRFDSLGRPINNAGVITAQNITVRHRRSLRDNVVAVATTGRIAVN